MKNEYAGELVPGVFFYEGRESKPLFAQHKPADTNQHEDAIQAQEDRPMVQGLVEVRSHGKTIKVPADPKGRGRALWAHQMATHEGRGFVRREDAGKVVDPLGHLNDA